MNVKLDALARSMTDSQFLDWLRGWLPPNTYARIEARFDAKDAELVELRADRDALEDELEELEQKAGNLAEELEDLHVELDRWMPPNR